MTAGRFVQWVQKFSKFKAPSYDSNQSQIRIADMRLCIYCNEHSHQARDSLTAADGDKSSIDYRYCVTVDWAFGGET